ncbi:FecR family protein [Pedobacter paludis]|uniref:FecR family protein n=1 Tax=Pedobacter paludis TaxID=2203212 RepID=A0A317EWV7_9SPHI|nr:FecR domain-containing protein [Pedobacter paludis]PWS30932.1 hypothetical protein DF947_15120 [Pedobacter paludis]
MLNKPEYLDLIVQYLNNPQDENLCRAVESFRTESSDQEKYFLEIEKVWNLSAKSSKLEGVNNKQAEIRFKRALKNIAPNSSGLLKWLSAAAATILIVGVSYWLYQSADSSTLLTKQTGKNQMDSVLLVDGSKIILSANSIVKYPKAFNSDSREIYLSKGRAFFKIAKDPKHPFRVLMGESKVSVLGTSFNIDYSPSKIDLDVKTGRVIFSPYQNGTSSILTAGQALTYNIQKKEFTARLSQNSDSWLTNELVFVDTPLEDVCKQLSDYYKTDIKLETNQQMVKKLNATFKHNSLDEVLAVLEVTYGLTIQKDKDSIILKTTNIN